MLLTDVTPTNLINKFKKYSWNSTACAKKKKKQVEGECQPPLTVSKWMQIYWRKREIIHVILDGGQVLCPSEKVLNLSLNAKEEHLRILSERDPSQGVIKNSL